jgi:hypothetical protein
MRNQGPCLSTNTRGSAFIQKVAVVGLFVLGAFGAINAFGQAVATRYTCVAATLLGTGGEACGEAAPLPAPPQNPATEPAPKLITEPATSNLTIENPPAIPPAKHTADEVCAMTADQQNKLNDALACDATITAQYNNLANYPLATCTPGLGSDAHSPNLFPENVMHIDAAKFENRGDLAVTMAHEMAHMEYGPLPDPADPGVTCEQYAAAMVANEANSYLAEFELLSRLYDSQGIESACYKEIEASMRAKHGSSYDTLSAYMNELRVDPSKRAEIVQKFAPIVGEYVVSGDGGTYNQRYLNSCNQTKGI